MANERHLAAIMASDVVGYSRMMGSDETGTLQALRTLRSDVLDPTYRRHRGRPFKLMGDGALVEFPSILDALGCAVEIQRSIAANQTSQESDPKSLRLRIGIHMGDVYPEGDDLYGDGVNIASRLEGVAPPGGICVSRTVFDQVQGKLPIQFISLGEQRLKNIDRPIEVYSVGVESPAAAAGIDQRIGFCRTTDGVRLAYATAGEGPPIVKAPNWISHLEYDWDALVYRGLFRLLSHKRKLVRFDARGNGLSDREVDQIDFEAFVDDMECVANAAGLERFPLLGISQGCAIAIAYALRHPERVTHLILHGGFATGAYKRGAAEAEQARAMAVLMREGIRSDNAAFRQLFASQFFPEGPVSAWDQINQFQRACISADHAYRFREVIGNIDINDRLGELRVPTLVTHSRGDRMQPIENGRALAAAIPGARFLSLSSVNHVLLEEEPAFSRFAEEVEMFLASV
jgi:class 3 adenylate cyclase/pimeloyl-ACP methyl ester carboxylesterase